MPTKANDFHQDAPPLYERVKQYIVDRIMSGEWPQGHRVPTEQELVGMLGISRMTVHRALRELMNEGMVRRRPGAGTFVHNERPRLDLVQVRDIAEEIALRGHAHASEVHLLRREKADHVASEALGIPLRAPFFHSLIVHLENQWPVQLEERYVNPAAAPAYLEQDFTRSTTYAYLMTTGPLDRVEHVVEAIRPSPRTCELLKISPEEPCLVLHRRTWSRGQVVSRAWLTHPGSRYRLGAEFGRAVPEEA
ncbi:MAG: histidine utilization repressor [Burkholderiales bacterium]|nr:histidine utilization repressor [Burkholderiales bacterium]OJX04718.1 MAG: histidine utilization repressor [Burkholderiales bacterium 70-64]